MLIVDAANVIGSRPDGWWRDRPGAARRFVDRVRAAADDGRIDAPVTVVLEGQARSGAAVGEAAGVTVVHAAGSGDDAIVDLARAAVPDAPADVGVWPSGSAPPVATSSAPAGSSTGSTGERSRPPPPPLGPADGRGRTDAVGWRRPDGGNGGTVGGKRWRTCWARW